MALVAKHQPRDFQSRIAQIALLRPGPIQGTRCIPSRGALETKSRRPFHTRVSSRFYAIRAGCCSQEQVMEIVHRFAGFDWGSQNGGGGYTALVPIGRYRRFVARQVMPQLERTNLERLRALPISDPRGRTRSWVVWAGTPDELYRLVGLELLEARGAGVRLEARLTWWGRLVFSAEDSRV
jgi:Bacterial DNA polymerase III alpha subunit finger domain